MSACYLYRKIQKKPVNEMYMFFVKSLHVPHIHFLKISVEKTDLIGLTFEKLITQKLLIVDTDLSLTIKFINLILFIFYTSIICFGNISKTRLKRDLFVRRLHP